MKSFWGKIMLLLFVVNVAIASTINTNAVIDLYIKSPKYVALEQEKQVSSSQLSQAKSVFSPRISAIGSYSYLKSSSPLLGNTDTEVYNTYLNATQELFRSGGIIAEYKGAKYTDSIEQWEIFSKHQKNLKQILFLFYDYLSSQQQQLALQESEKIQKEFLRLTERKAKQGNARAYELSQAKADYLSFQSRLLTIEQQILSQKESLKLELQLVSTENFEFSESSDEIIKKAEQVSKLALEDKNERSYKWQIALLN
jgi:outer membrane protein TolC